MGNKMISNSPSLVCEAINKHRKCCQNVNICLQQQLRNLIEGNEAEVFYGHI